MPNDHKTKPRLFISHGIVAENRKAKFEYEILSTITAGLVLKGSEVKSLRLGLCQLSDSYASLKNGELYLFNISISPYIHAKNFNSHKEKSHRKILVTKKEQKKLIGAVKEKGLTLVPLKIFFNGKGIAKVDLALARGKSKGDKRQTIKTREWQRQQQRLLKH